jgi:UDP-3-O-[3-hydroxymyristoyl] glucosamine N-acyltransferase
MRINEIAAMVHGQVIGDGDLDIRGVAGIDDAGSGDITYLTNKTLLKKLLASQAAAVIVADYIEDIKMTQVAVKTPQYAFAALLNAFYVKPHKHLGISDRAIVSDQAEIGDNVTVYPMSYISDGVHIGKGTVVFPGVFIGEKSSIGEECLIYPNVTIREGVTIGNNVIIHAGAVIGADGFGYVFENGIHNKIPQVGGVVISDDVEIGANVTIDRGTTGNTVIGKGTKIDNLVQVAHNVLIGRNVLLVAQVGIGGSSSIGEGVILAGQAGIGDHAEIEAGTIVGGQAGVAGRLSKGMYLGTPARPFREALKSVDLLHRLPELNKKIIDIEKKLASLIKDDRAEGA